MRIEQMAGARVDSSSILNIETSIPINPAAQRRPEKTPGAETRTRRTAEEIILEARAETEKARKNEEKDRERMVVVDESGKRVKTDRNLPSPCGSGKKFKKCCGRNN